MVSWLYTKTNARSEKYSQSIVKRSQEVKNVRWAIMQVDQETAIQKRLILRLRDRKQVMKDLRMSLELTTMDFEGGGTGGDQNDVAVFEPDARAN
jgi:hypothetical protein